jgi:hypothetical protein
MTDDQQPLLQPYQMADLHLANRIVMAPADPVAGKQCRSAAHRPPRGVLRTARSKQTLGKPVELPLMGRHFSAAAPLHWLD